MEWPDCVPTLLDVAAGVSLRAHAPEELATATAAARQLLRAGWAAGRMATWAIEAEGAYAGTVGLWWKAGDRALIAVGPATSAGPAAVLPSAVRLALDWAFEVRGLSAITSETLVGDWPRRRLMAECGLRDEGVRRAGALRAGRLVDIWTATIMADEPRTSRLLPRAPRLDGAGVRLRTFTEVDLPRMVEAHNDALTREWTPRLAVPFGPDDAIRLLESYREAEFGGSQWSWCISDARDRCLGGLTLSGPLDPNGHAELGYWLHPQSRGHGTATAAVRLLTRYAWTWGRTSLEIRCGRAHRASQAVAARAGFRCTGHLPGAERLRNGAAEDLLIWSLRRD